MATHIRTTDGPGSLRVRPSRELFEQIPAPTPMQPGAKRGYRPRLGLSVPNMASAISIPIGSARRASQDDWLARKSRLLFRLVKIDSPFMWRLAAHAAVSVLTIGVIASTSLPRVTRLASASLGTAPSLTDWTQRARSFVPSSVVGVNSPAPGAASPLAIQGNDLPGFVSPGAVAEAHPSLLPWDEPEHYRVVRGDTVTRIAARFNVEPLWLLYANPGIRDKPHDLSVGKELTVLPMKAVVHVVEEGDSVAGLAEKYKTDVEKIVGYDANGLASADAPLAAGTELVLPDGEMEINIPSYRDLIAPRGTGGWAQASALGTMVGSGHFYVGAYGRRTQGYHRWHRAADIAAAVGTPIYAIDSGVVKYAGWYSWAGNAVIIDHGNGFESLYAHMSRINVAPGQQVQRGGVIGGIGCSYGRGGRCTGPHLHLEIRLNGVLQNPCALGACP